MKKGTALIKIDSLSTLLSIHAKNFGEFFIARVQLLFGHVKVDASHDLFKLIDID